MGRLAEKLSKNLKIFSICDSVLGAAKNIIIFVNLSNLIIGSVRHSIQTFTLTFGEKHKYLTDILKQFRYI